MSKDRTLTHRKSQANDHTRSPLDVTERLDKLIQDLRTRFHAPAFAAQKEARKQPSIEDGAGDGDVLIVAHGHILRAFAMRWVGRKLTDGVSLILEGMSCLHFIQRPLERMDGINKSKGANEISKNLC